MLMAEIQTPLPYTVIDFHFLVRGQDFVSLELKLDKIPCRDGKQYEVLIVDSECRFNEDGLVAATYRGSFQTLEEAQARFTKFNIAYREMGFTERK